MERLPLPVLLAISEHLPDEEDWERVQRAFGWRHPVFDYHRMLHIHLRRLNSHLARHSREQRDSLARSHVLSLPSNTRHLADEDDVRSARGGDEMYVYDEALLQFWHRIVEAERDFRRVVLGRRLCQRPSRENLIDARIVPDYTYRMDRLQVRRRWLYEQVVAESQQQTPTELIRRDTEDPSPRMPHEEFAQLLANWQARPSSA